MNGYTLAGSFNGALGEYPISQIVNIDKDINTNLYSTNEIFFFAKHDSKTKIDTDGVLRIYHEQTVTLPTVVSQWISVEDAIIYLLQEDLQWNAQSLDNTAKFSLIDAAIASLGTQLGITTEVANTASGVATAAAAASALNTQAIATIVNTDIPNTSNYASNLCVSTSNYAEVLVSGCLLKSGGTMTGDLIGTNIDLSGSLTTNSIIYNTQELSTSLSYYLLKEGGTLTGNLNFNTQLFGDPVASQYGYNGDRIVLNPGSAANTYPFSLGVNTNYLWYLVPPSKSHKFYSGGTNTLTLDGSGNLTATGEINAPTIKQGGVPLTTTLNNYVLKSGSTMTGTLTINGASGLSHQLILNNNNYSTFPNIKLSAGDIYEASIGFGGLFSQNYQNNLFLESTGKIILNTNGNSISGTPNFIINTNGNVGIGVLNPIHQFTIGTAPTNTGINVVMGIQNSAGTTNYFGTGGTALSGYWANNFFLNARNDLVIYTNGETAMAIPNMIIKANGNIGIGVGNPSTKLDVNGGIKATSLTTNSIIYNTQELSTSLSYYLLKSGGELSGNITFDTQLFGDPAPMGFNGDRIILQQGISPNGYPYSVGINTDVFWNCAPSTASYKWYSGATNTMTLNNTGDLTTSTSISSPKVNCVDATGVSSTTLIRNFNMVGQAAVLRIWRNHSTFNPSLEFLWGPTTAANSYTWFWDMYIGAGGSASSNNFFAIRDRKGGGGVNRLIIDDNGNVGIGITPNPSYKLDINGALNTPSITSANIIMSGQIIGVTTLSATTGIFGTLATTNNTNVGAPTKALYGGIGDKLIFYTGSPDVYPYSFGINTNELWYSVPNVANHNFYCGGNNILSIYGSTLARSVTVKGDLIVNSSPSLANQLAILSSLSNANANLLIQNNEGYSCFLGVGGTATTGNYKNNLFITSSRDIIFNTFGRGTSATPDMMITSNGNVGINVVSPNCKLDVRGIVNITNTNPYAVPNNKMQSGSLTIGDCSLDYGNEIYTVGGGWTGNNTAGLLLECSTSTEIVVHDSGNRLTSLMAYYGGITNTLEIGRNMGGGWDKPLIQLQNHTQISGNLSVNGRITTNQFYTTTVNQIITNTISIAPTSTAYNGYWQINIDAYKIANQYNYLIFSCSVNYAGTVGYWTGRILVYGSSIISVADFNTTNIYLSFANIGGILYLTVNANGFYPTSNSLLYYKIIG